jgi:predicted Fe-S protein YdhL (DUF1289 family)
MKERIKSPCIKKCRVNADKVCTSCLRTLEEIAAWGDADDEVRQKILANVRFRKKTLGRSGE